MNLEQIDHLAISCQDPDRSKDWYIQVLGFEHIYPDEWNGVPIFLKLGSTALALFPESHSSRLQPNPAKGISHFALRANSQSDFQTAQKELQTHNINFEYEDYEVAHSIYFNDPDGHRLEITTYDTN
ncbi:MAG: VOC family protein [Opitutales bacterium]|jgi:catechol 2,3-dioxygenase-like lactoylglutathione lyase family enzyme|nr:VOC family protein [Opitutales bacterium]